MNIIQRIINDNAFSKEEIIKLLQSQGEDRNLLFRESAIVKKNNIGNITYLRGLVEISNNCIKNCFYCGIRADNQKVNRYFLNDEEIIEAIKFAYKNNYASVVLQSGENQSKSFTLRIEKLLEKIIKETNNEIAITLSIGEQSKETYKRWKNSGATRYLLRIETSDIDLYSQIHPSNKKHDYYKRVECLYSLKELDYQLGTGVMVGLPFQKIEHLANDLDFMRNLDIDMCGMGPYIEHHDTPLYQYKNLLLPLSERFELTLKMIAILRMMMKDINIAATTAMQAIDKLGREKAIKIGANVIMPNVTPGKFRNEYNLYENKPCTDEEALDCLNCIEARISIAGDKIGLGMPGTSLHFKQRIIK